ncbi:acetolactate synthase large subunit [Paenirhodobacter populi]|uniref:Acetolactate synthase large subunit n=1 Tax=Paenirhodobacter populi TaxID=2306993 RepID=A0A443INY1_9RHOB|nr:acetolactate synthase large subunit [Sinirhodobacter populi]RWR07228.1 acetolactate synthase large subunit [Sinirhodobacter populi]
MSDHRNSSDQAPAPQTGAEALVRTLVAGGVDTCFANPGTSEMHFVAALDRIPGIRCVLGLQENTVTGMADGYYRVAGRPAATLLHCGPGLANGIANLHNARRGQSGIVNITGDHAIPHVPFDSPLTADVRALAGTVSGWQCVSTSPERIGPDAARAIAAAGSGAGHGQVATLVLPADVSWGAGGTVGAPQPVRAPLPPDPIAIENAAQAIRRGGNVLMVLGTAGLTLEAQPYVHSIAKATGLTAYASGMVAIQPRGRGRLDIPAVPYPVDVAIQTLAAYDTVITVNCPVPTGFFLYPGRPSLVTNPAADHHVLSRVDQDALAALQRLAEALSVTVEPVPLLPATPFAHPEGPIEPEGFAEVVCDLIPENAIVVNESLTLGAGLPSRYGRAAPFDWLGVTGGAIGGGLPLATGAAVAARGRRVIGLQADGSAAYTMQALWTQAREKLPCLTLLLNNRSYAILQGEYTKVGADPGPTAMDMLSLDRPDLDWVALAGSMGVPGIRVDDLTSLRIAMQAALEREGPFLIDVRFA